MKKKINKKVKDFAFYGDKAYVTLSDENIDVQKEMEHPAFYRKLPREVKKMHPTCACEPLRLTNVNSLLIGYILGVLTATII